MGSHSLRRRRVKETNSYQENRDYFQKKKIDYQKNRGWVYKLTLDKKGKSTNKKKISLWNIIKKDEVLKTFSKIPSKENGVDIEGVAIKNKWLYVGFRGPVFRENYVPVLKLKFNKPEAYELLYVNLGGRGIRDIQSVSDGFLILAGLVGDGTDSYQLYHWDGKDLIPGEDRKKIGTVNLLGEIWTPPEGKAEGLVILEEKNKSYDLIIAYDGILGQPLKQFKIQL